LSAIFWISSSVNNRFVVIWLASSMWGDVVRHLRGRSPRSPPP
jgi:hypothetical protein